MVIRFFAKPILKSFEDGKKTNSTSRPLRTDFRRVIFIFETLVLR
ncbi:MAG: hypothetical protein ACTSQK_01255 [Candidatus Heimdallarchaeota archaeon]